MLCQWLQAALQEYAPSRTEWIHLQDTVATLFDPLSAPCWWIDEPATDQPVACLWLGRSLDQLTGHGIAYILLVRVDPGHRRQGLGTALLQQAEDWARRHHLAGLQLQVFADNEAALQLYSKVGFALQGYWLAKQV